MNQHKHAYSEITQQNSTVLLNFAELFHRMHICVVPQNFATYAAP